MNGGHVYVQPTQYLVAINDKEVKKRKKGKFRRLKEIMKIEDVEQCNMKITFFKERKKQCHFRILFRAWCHWVIRSLIQSEFFWSNFH